MNPLQFIRLAMTFLCMSISVQAFGIPSKTVLRRASSTRLFATKSPKPKEPVPITLLSGFLGSGKTSALKHLLENTEGARLGVVVNDVASVNIDQKLISSSTKGVVELQNGCACCSLADELFTSVQTLLEGPKERQFDALVVELSGVADPVAIKTNWNTAKMTGNPAAQMADISRVVTLVDACTFGTDWMTWDMAGQRDGWLDGADGCSAMRKVTELLAEQVEAADLILINKVDLAGEEQVKVASSVARGINDKAELREVQFGRVSPKLILEGPKTKQTEDSASCEDPDCSDPTHDHSHSHDHACADPDCTDESHGHSHSHDHACEDPDCTDPTHDHSHSHSHSTSTDQLGIVNFVYKAQVPFHTNRLMNLLSEWPVPIKDDLDLGLLQDAQNDGYEIRGEQKKDSPFVGVIRSKGFCWFAPTHWSGKREDAWRHDTAMYWSHAGRHFGISTAGKWWGTIGKEKMKDFFVDHMEEYDRIIRDDFVSEEFGDRRQELVFIGTGLDEATIRAELDKCLLTDEEMAAYRQELQNYYDTIFNTPVPSGGGLFDVGAVDQIDLEE